MVHQDFLEVRTHTNIEHCCANKFWSLVVFVTCTGLTDPCNNYCLTNLMRPWAPVTSLKDSTEVFPVDEGQWV
jgi:hypothetical protein